MVFEAPSAVDEIPDGLVAVRARLHAFIARRVASGQIADDLTQEVLVRLLTAFRSGRHPALDNPTAWLYRIARNVIVDHYRAQTKIRERQADDELAEGLAEDPFAEDPEAAARELAGCLRLDRKSVV